MKIIINKTCDPFILTNRALLRMFKRKNKPVYFYYQLQYIDHRSRCYSDMWRRITEEEILQDEEQQFCDAVCTTEYLGERTITSKIYERTERNIDWSEHHTYRTDKDLLEVFKTYGEDYCSASYSKLEVIEIPDDVEWEIEESPIWGEVVAEKHRTWK